MESRFHQVLLKDFEILPGSRILAAVSGGMDSIAMLHLLKSTGHEIGVAHVNFSLRGEESDSDEAFVKNLAKKYGFRFYCKRFDTASLAESENISIQMAARKMRYLWFEEIRLQNAYDWIATAHNIDDQIETFFINLLRGTGISGIKGIPQKSGTIIRPMLSFYRSEIAGYISENRLKYKEDSSNSEIDYLRNRIRHQLIPLIEEMQPGFRKVMVGNLAHFSQTEELLRSSLKNIASQVILSETVGLNISIDRLSESRFPMLVLYEILKEFGFGSTQILQIWRSTQGQPGKHFYSATHRLIKDRNKLIVQALSEIEDQGAKFEIAEGTPEVQSPVHLQFHSYPRSFDFQPSTDPHKAFLDADTIMFPLKIRKWKKGDRFKPLGMKGEMKLSDFFTANKFSIAEKESTWLLTDVNNQIVWIIAYRISRVNRIKPTTTNILAITLCK